MADKNRPKRSAESEEQRRNDAGRRRRGAADSIRNIGRIPPIANIERRQSCRLDLEKFILTYAGEGKDPFSDDHKRVIKRIENCILNGGRFVEAVYRGFGKSTISNIAAVWALIYAHRRFIPLVRANSDLASDGIDAIKSILETDLLVADFPEICFPVQELEGITQRAHGQMYEPAEGEPTLTKMKWGADCIVFPSTDGAFDDVGNWHENLAAGAVLLAAGITSSKLRGMNKRREDGIFLRPDFAIIDDPQDEESAASPQQIAKRLNIIKKAILKSAGHKKGMAVIMPCTVIQKDDLVDQLLDPKKNPAWQGERIPFVRKWADKNDDLWMEEYRHIRTTHDPDDPDDYLRARKEATAFYSAHREEMDAGMITSWQYCFLADEDEISANQHAYNALIDDGPEVFASEFQNEPFLPPEEEGQLTRETVVVHITGMARNEIPTSCEKLTAFIDVQHAVLYYTVCAYTSRFDCYVVDYGCFPEQNKISFALRDVTKTLQGQFPGTGQEGAWRAGFESLCEKLCTREYIRDDGAAMRLNRGFIDSGEGNATQTVYDFCRQSKWGGIFMASRGKGVTAASIPFCDYKRHPGDRVSKHNWRIPSATGRAGGGRFVLYDTNFWKTFTRSRWNTSLGDKGCLYLFGINKNAPVGAKVNHSMFIDQMVSEYSVRTEGRGRTVDEWQMRPNNENHLWDCLVGCMVAASEQGVELGEGGGGSAGRPSTLDARARLSRLGNVRKVGLR
ncbi:MAG: terminase gpA endonuclease subunit [Candidatus Omnitrophota bacterium]|jgi:hypothetical protein